MARPSENKYYESSDLTGLNQNLKRLLGMSGSVDRDRLSDLRTFSLLQGTEMDNRKKDALWNALQDSIGQEGLTFDQILMRNLGKSATDIQGGFTGEALLPSKKRKSELLADQEQQVVDEGNLKKKLSERIANYTPFNPSAPVTDDTGQTRDQYDRDVRNFLVLSGLQPGINLDTTGERARLRDRLKTQESESELAKDTSVIDLNKAKEEGYKNVSAEKVKKIQADVNSITTLTAARKKEIINRVLNNIAKLDQTILTEKSKRKLLDEKIKTEIQKELTEKERTAKEKGKSEIVQLKLKDMPNKLKVELANLKKKGNKIDADIKRINASERTQVSQAALNAARRMKLQVEKSIARALEPYRKDLLEARAEKARRETSTDGSDYVQIGEDGTITQPDEESGGGPLDWLMNLFSSDSPEDTGTDNVTLDNETAISFDDLDDLDENEEDTEEVEEVEEVEEEGIGTKAMELVNQLSKALVTRSQPAIDQIIRQNTPVATTKNDPRKTVANMLMSTGGLPTWSKEQRNQYIDYVVKKFGLPPREAANLLAEATRKQLSR